MTGIRQDLRYALRGLRKSPGFAVAAVMTLALGSGANTAIFSVVNAVLLTPLPYPDPNRLIVFLNTSPQGSGPGASPTKFNVWRRQTSAFEHVSAYRFTPVNITASANPEQVAAGHVSVDFFSLFGAPVAWGRTFTADEDRPSGARVVVLSDGFWRRRFGGAPGVVGQTIPINGDAHLVIGVLGPFDTAAIRGGDDAPDVWLPFQIDPNSTMHGHFFLAAGRLKPHVTPDAATAQLQGAWNEFRQLFPGATGPQSGFGVRTLHETVVRNVRPSLLVLVGAVGFVLLIACANVANLLMVRATSRRREIAIRAAIGAGRHRIIRQLLTESLVLSLVGGVFGLVLGIVGIRALLALSPGNIPRIGADPTAVGVDWRVLLFTVCVSIATGIIFGLLPALRASRADLSGTLRESGGLSGGGLRHNKARAVLVVTEVGLALVLLIGATLLIRTFVALRSVNPGFDPQQVLTLRMSLAGEGFASTSAVAQVIRLGRERVNALPGIEAVGATCCVPLQGGLGLPFIIEGRPLQERFHGGGGFIPTSAGFFAAFKIPLVRGRDFTDRDTGGAANVAIINEAMARQYWPNGDPLTDRITIAKGLPQLEDPTRQIVGIVGDVRGFGLNVDPGPMIYVPWAQVPDAHNANLVGIVPLAWIVRTRGEPYSMSAAIQTELRQASGGLPVARPQAMEEIIVESTARSDFNTFLLSIFASSALLLAAIGIYGLMAYSVQQRTREIGVRLALGAEPVAVRNMIVRQGMGIALVGILVGIVSALVLTRVIASSLFGVTTRDPMSFATVPVVLCAVALVGVWLPARRAARVDPLVALRYE